MHPRDETIYALSSGRPPAALAVVRVSGPQATTALTALAGRCPPPRRATRATLRAADGAPIDDAIVVFFEGPASATGEDVAELHVHGSRAVLAALFAALSAVPGLRPAEAGEFTRRGFENGKLDLTEAEALDDLIHADTDRQRRQALRQLQGLLGDKARDWRERIVEAMALIEAGIDFSDEGDVPAELLARARPIIAGVAQEIETVLSGEGRSERLRDGLVVAIAGLPNVGKSTLLNRLAKRELAIVSPHAGTTRDVVEAQLDLSGYPVTLIDTAGLRDSDDPVEQEGIRRARERATGADLVLWLSDREGGESPAFGAAPVWRILTKIDREAGPVAERSRVDAAISALTGEGIETLVARLVDYAASALGTGDDALIGRQRQRDLLEQCCASLRSSLTASVEEIAAEELRRAALALGRLVGIVDVEEVLGKIFESFCIGK